MASGGGKVDRKSLAEVHGSIGVSHPNPFKRLFAFLGPAYLVSVGYMDPGNWATDLEGGARFGYALLWVLLMSNIMAVILQTLSARLGVVTGHDLAQACRAEYSRPINLALWLLAEIAIAACDLAEVVGTVIALKLLFGLPLLWGCLVTAFDTFLLLWLQRFGMRKMEAAILGLVVTIGACFLVEIVLARPELGGIVQGFRPSLPDGALLVAIGILGATVMPHNLYLHSALVQSRRIGQDRESKKKACRYNLIDSALALNVAFFVNAAILILSAAVFHRGQVAVASIEEAYRLLPGFLGSAAPILFGVALLCAGQSSTLTGTLAGQIIMEGYLDLKVAPWLRRVITRSLALIPAVLTIALVGEQATQQLLVLSQVVLSLQLSFAVIPLIHFTSDRRNMGSFSTPIWGQVLAWTSAAIIVALNARLVWEKIQDWVEAASKSGLTVGPIPMGWVVEILLDLVALSALGLLVWVTIKPWVRPSPPWKPEPTPKLNWADALRPRQIKSIGIALERGSGDSEILSRALALAELGKTRLILLHVVDSTMTRVYGSETADRETDADERYLAEVVQVLEEKGYPSRSILLYGPDRAAKLIDQLKADPVDLLVVGSHGHGLVQDILFGQTVDRVRHGLTIPMLIARPMEIRPGEATSDDSAKPLR
jgi:manganese transport protein